MCNANKDAFHEYRTQTSWKQQWATKELHVALSVMLMPGAKAALSFLMKPAERTYDNRLRGSAGHKFYLFNP